MTRIAAVNDRAALLTEAGYVDLESASNGEFGPDVMTLWDRCDDLIAWAATCTSTPEPVDGAVVSCPVPRASQVFAIGLNYRTHGEESGMALPRYPLVFTKFPSSLSGPTDPIELVSGKCDWEVELVVVIGKGGRHIAETDAFAHVAGYTVGQDVSERRVQMSGSPAQFSLGKSFATFSPIGPAVVCTDEIADPSNLTLTCSVDGEEMQNGSTSDLLFSVPALVSYLSSICELRPGDLIFTGTPSGVGAARKPPRFLRDGEVVTSSISGIGTMSNACIDVTV